MIDLSDPGCLRQFPQKPLLKAIEKCEDVDLLTRLFNLCEGVKISGGIYLRCGHLGFEDIEVLQSQILLRQEQLISLATRRVAQKENALDWQTRETYEQKKTNPAPLIGPDNRIHPGRTPRRRARRDDETL